jgi:hypothetical protein
MGDGCHKGHVAEGEKAPFCCCCDMRIQLKHMREELDRLKNAGLGHSGPAQRMEASIDAGLGHIGLDSVACSKVLCEPGLEFGPTPCIVSDDSRPIPLLVGRSKGTTFINKA